MKIQLTEEQERKLAAKLRAMFDLRQYNNMGPEPRVMLFDGYGTKTDLGLARTVVGVIEEIIKEG